MKARGGGCGVISQVRYLTGDVWCSSISCHRSCCDASIPLRVAALNMCGSVVSVWFPPPLILSSSSWEMARPVPIGWWWWVFIRMFLFSHRRCLLFVSANSARLQSQGCVFESEAGLKAWDFPLRGASNNVAYEAVLISVCLSLALVHNWNE